MNLEQRGLLTLLKSAVTGEQLSLPEGFDLESARTVAKKHSVLPMVYTGALNCGIDEHSPLMQQMFMEYYGILMRSEKQMKAVKRLFDAFEQQGIDYMPLKGCNLKMLYPKPELRQMGDADVLIREAQYESIRPIVIEQGFEEKIQWDHVFLWKRTELVLELHRKLIPEDTENSQHFGDGWQLARNPVGHRYSMSPEDEYVFIFAHFVKHYKGDGIGLRHVMDLWVYAQQHPEMDQAVIRRELQRIHLDQFHAYICRLLQVWFEDMPTDDRSDFITDYIFANGNWGTRENHDVSKAAVRATEAGSARKGRVRQLMRFLNPPKEVMLEQFPVLAHRPYLRALCVPLRILRIVVFEREKISRAHQKLSAAASVKIETYRQAMDYVGLDCDRED